MSTPVERMERELRRLVEVIHGLHREVPEVDETGGFRDAHAAIRGASNQARAALAAATTCPRCAGEGECPCP